MQTIGRHYFGPRFNFTDLCDYCGTPWHRHELTLNADGLLWCPQCNDGGMCLRDIADASAAETGYVEPIRAKTREGV